MKRIINLLLVFMLILSLSACDKNEQTSPILLDDLSTTATLKGSVTYNRDLTQSEYEEAPAGTKILFKIATNQFTNRPHQNNYLVFETTVTGTGNFEIKLPATNAGVNVEIIPVEFKTNQTIAPGTTQLKVFTAPQTTINLVTNQTRFRDVVYN